MDEEEELQVEELEEVLGDVEEAGEVAVLDEDMKGDDEGDGDGDVEVTLVESTCSILLHDMTTWRRVGYVARNRDWAAVTASLSILAHVAQSCCMQAARMPKSRSSTCMWSARRESGTLCRFVFARLRSFRVLLCGPFSFL